MFLRCEVSELHPADQRGLQWEETKRLHKKNRFAFFQFWFHSFNSSLPAGWVIKTAIRVSFVFEQTDLCASWRVAAARRCVWNVSRRKPSCRRTASRRCAAGHELWAATFSWTSSRSRGRDRCASSSPLPRACTAFTQTYPVRHTGFSYTGHTVFMKN